MINLSSEHELKEITQINEWVLVYFWAIWCEPCQSMEPLVQRVVKNHSEQLILVKANADKLTELIRAFKIESVPQILLFYQGQLAGSIAGAFDETALESWLKDQTLAYD